MLTAQRERMTAAEVKLTEQQVTSQIVEWLQWRGWLAHRKHVGEFIAIARVMDWLSELVDAMRRGGLTAVRELAMKAMREFPRAKVTLGKAGIPDWLFTHPHYHPAIYIEMKATGKKPDPHQLLYIEQLQRDGYRATWCNSFEMFEVWYNANVVAEAAIALPAASKSA